MRTQKHKGRSRLVRIAALLAMVAAVEGNPGSLTPTQKPPGIKHSSTRSSRQPKQCDIVTNPIGISLTFIHAGEFFIGRFLSAKQVAAKYGGEETCFADEEPLHLVEISKGFWMGQMEVTRRRDE